jgi:hypothetical protein
MLGWWWPYAFGGHAFGFFVFQAGPHRSPFVSAFSRGCDDDCLLFDSLEKRLASLNARRLATSSAAAQP